MCISNHLSTSTKDPNENANRAPNGQDFDKDKENENAFRYKYTNENENRTKEQLIKVGKLYEDVYDALRKVSDALSQVSESTAKLLKAVVLVLPMAWISSRNVDTRDTLTTKVFDTSRHVFKRCPSCEQIVPKTGLIKEIKQKPKVI